jgi:hypothetical protein
MKKLSIIISLLIICLCLFGCGENPGKDPGDPEPAVVLHNMAEITKYLAEAEGGATPEDPIPLAVDIDFSLSLELTTVIGTGDKYVALDLTRGVNVPAELGTSFDGNRGVWYYIPSYIPSRADVYLPNVVSISLPVGITSLYPALFAQCMDMRKITLPKGLVAINQYSLDYCPNLELLILHATKPPEMGGISFNSVTPEFKIKVPKKSVDAYKTSRFWSYWADKISAI